MKRNAIRLAQEVLRDRRKRADGGTDEWQSTGRLINEDDSINWGNPEVASDFFRADKEDLRRRREAEKEEKLDRSDVTGSIPPVRTSEGRQMAEAPLPTRRPAELAGEAPTPPEAPAPAAPKLSTASMPLLPGATPIVEDKFGPMPPAMQAVANRYSPPEYKEALTDEQRQALALEQWKAAGRSGTPDNPNPAPPAAAPAPIVQASLTTATPQQTATDANRQPLRFAPTEGAEKPAPATAPTSAILAAIRANESRNKPTAQNPRSSAGGLYQFLDSTWGNVLRRMDPQQYGGYSDRQLRSLKTDPRYVDLQHAAADFMLNKDIAPRLEKAGIPLTPGSAYLSWFQGPAGAIKTYTAPDNATVSQVFPRTVAANSNMRFNGKPYANWTMSDLRQWADTKMAQRMQPARQPLRFGPVEGYEEGGRVGYANEGAVRDPDDPRQWLEFGGQEMDRAPAGLPIGQAVGTSTAGHIGAGFADAAELAHQAATNQLPPDYFQTEEGIGRAFNAASTPMLGSFALSHAVGPTVNAGETLLGMSVKPKGGNWLAGSIERETKGVKSGLNPEQVKWENEHYALEAADPVRYPEQAAQANAQIQRNNTHLALDNWIDKKLNKYIQNELATPEDPIRLLAERGILHVQPESLYTTFRNVPGQTRIAESQAAKAWEDVADKSITTFPAEEYMGSGWNFTRDKQDKVQKENPWLEKLPGETPVYEVDPHRGVTEYLGFDHLKDELFNATRHDSVLPANLRLTPDKLEKVSVPQAVELVAKINKWREEAAAKALSKNSQNDATHLVKEYPDQGYKWVELKNPTTVAEDTLKNLSTSERARYDRYIASGDTPHEALLGVLGDYGASPSLKAALKYEGDMMGHCVGGYCEDVASGRSRIFSLRDKDGKPHVTIETGPDQHLNGFGNAVNEIEPGLWEKMVKKGAHHNSHEWLRQNRPDVYEKLMQESVIQVKGKGNMKPKDEYIPFVQDFIRSREWGKIGDSRNIDMARITKPVKIGDNLEIPPGYYTQEDVKNLLAEKGLSEQIPWDLLYSKLRHYDSDFARGGLVEDAMAVARAAGGRIGYANEGRVKEENPNDWLQFAGKNQEEIPTGVPISEESSAILKPMGVDLPQEAKTPLITKAQSVARLIKSDQDIAPDSESSLASFIPKDNPQRGKNFDNWFGESIVRNQDGTPKTVYHGTGSDFSIFRPSATGEFGPGIYATDLADEASAYAGTHPEGTGQNVMPVHIRMEQPFVAKDPSEFWEKFGGKTDAEAMENAKRAGYDGVIIERPYTIYDEKRKQFYPTGQNHTHYVVFDPGQIKSATGNKGTFSLKDTDITKNSGGTVDRAMNTSQFGTDAVQTAVNLARQHRGRPENPRSTS